MLALEYHRSLPAYLAARATRGRSVELATGMLSGLRLAEIAEPRLPAPNWLRLRPRLAGICGSDLSLLRGQSSLYFSALTSFPFVPGHELVADVIEAPAQIGVREGDRVVLEPALGCLVRGLAPFCRNCAQGLAGLCERAAEGSIGPGLQTGYCRDTSGGWSQQVLAHPSQVHKVSDELSDAAAVLLEPLACCIHAVLAAQVDDGSQVLVLGCGSVGLLTIVALKALHPKVTILASAKYPEQARWAQLLGADQVCEPDQLYQRARFMTGARRLERALGPPVFLGGFANAFECVGSAVSLSQAIACTRARGRVHLVGMPSQVEIDLGPVWQREIGLVGSYTYGLEHCGESAKPTFDIAAELAQGSILEQLVGPAFALRDFREAIGHAWRAGPMGLTKVVFKPESR